MGVPRLFRLLVERYPLILRAAEEAPQFDNFYIDFNGVVHTCTHGNDASEGCKTEEDMMMAMFSYIETLFAIVRPTSLLYIAIDGVTPRAKRNQQRQRRFRAAIRIEDTEEEDSDKDGDEGNDDKKPFDSNCITPGTEFMQKLDQYLRYFVQRKIEEDKAWRDIKVIVSGHLVPGEGEHKIMDFIRSLKSQPNYNPNTRHCLHGLDADLIMLALATHEPHFCILREKVLVKSKRKKVMNSMRGKDVSFQATDEHQLLHIGLLRQYIELEFTLQETSKETDAARLVDDFVFLTFFLGNDFLPSIPTADTDDGGLTVIFDVYRRAKSTSDGYLVNADTCEINPTILRALLELLAGREPNYFALNATSNEGEQAEEAVAKEEADREAKPATNAQAPGVPEDMARAIDAFRKMHIDPPRQEKEKKKPAEKKGGHAQFFHPVELSSGRPLLAPSAQDRLVRAGKVPNEPIPVLGTESFTATEKKGDGGKDIPSIDVNTSEQRSEKETKAVQPVPTVETKTAKPANDAEAATPSMDSGEPSSKLVYMPNKDVKASDSQSYYISRFGEDCREAVIRCYFEGLKWVLLYYYHGAPWDWCFPFYFPPLASDLLDGSATINDITFPADEPFTPLQQLLAVMPPASSYLLPPALRTLTTKNEELTPFFPTSYEFYADKKGREWRDIALIPFVDDNILLKVFNEAIATSSLTDEDKARNELRTARLFMYDKSHPIQNDSPLPTVLKSLKTRCAEKPFTPWPIPGGQFHPKVPEGCFTGILQPPAGFPSIKYIGATARLENAKVEVLFGPSRLESLVLAIEPFSIADHGEEIVDPLLRNDIIRARGAQLSRLYIGKTGHSGYPFVSEGQIVSVIYRDTMWKMTKRGQIVDSLSPHPWEKLTSQVRDKFLRKSGIDTGEIPLLVEVRQIVGMSEGLDGSIKKQYSDKSVFVPVTLLPSAPPRPDPRLNEQEALVQSDRFKPGDMAIYLGESLYGEIVRVVKRKKCGDDADTAKLYMFEIQGATKSQEAKNHLSSISAAAARNGETFTPSGRLGQHLGVSGLALSRLSGSITVLVGDVKVDIGLGLKFARKGLMIAGFTRRVADKRQQGRYNWEFSSSGCKVVSDFLKEFPDLFRGVENDPKKDNFEVESLFLDESGKPMQGDCGARLEEVMQWIQTCPISALPLVPCESSSLSLGNIESIEKAAKQVSSSPRRTVDIANAAPIELLKPICLPLSARETEDFRLGDRVVNIRTTGPVPVGLQGAVVAVYKNVAEVVFDETFLSASNLNGRCTDFRGFAVPFWALLNLTTKKRVVSKSVAAAAIGKKKKKKKNKGGGNSNKTSNPFDLLGME